MRENLPEDAGRLLENPAFDTAMGRLKSEIIRNLERAEFDGSQKQERYREKLTLMLQCAGRFELLLRQMLQSGELKTKQLERRTLINKRGL